MSAEDKKIIQSITQAVVALPQEKREFILGYAEGVIAMASCKEPAQAQSPGA